MIYCDLSLGSVNLWSGIPCLNAVSIGVKSYLPFTGYLMFVDSQGNENPDYTGIGDGGRFQLLYFTTVDDIVRVPLKAIPAQQFDIDLGNQSVTITLYQK